MAATAEKMEDLDRVSEILRSRAVDVVDAVQDYAPADIQKSCEVSELFAHYGQCVETLRAIADRGGEAGIWAAAALLDGVKDKS